jgi:hypothetical protein
MEPTYTVPSDAIAGDENTASDVGKSQYEVFVSGPVISVVAVCHISWLSMGHELLARWAGSLP